MPRVLAVMLPGLLWLCSCPESPPLSIDVADVIEADGTTRIPVVVRARDPIEGAVVELTATGGALASSTARLIDGEATVELIAPREKELGRKESRPIELTATVVLSAEERLTAGASLVAVAPSLGPPLVFVDADPPAAVAGSGAEVTIAIVSRRVAPGSSLAVSTSAGTLSATSVTINDDGTGALTLTPPASPADAEVIVDDGTSASARTVVRFVAAGQPLFDVTGSFAQLGPARVKLESGALTPNPQCTVAPSVVLATFTQAGPDGLTLDAAYTTCDVAFPAVTSIVGTVTNEATEAFYAAIPVVVASFTVGSGELGARYEPPPSVVVVGADLDDPENDPLPTEETDPRVVDADNDGAPGVTVENSLGGQQRIVFRNIGVGTGRIRSSNHIVGDVPGDLLATTETSVFGIGGAFLPDTIALGSVVELVRVDGRFGSVNADTDNDGAVSCAELTDVVGQVTTLEVPDTPFDCGGIE